MEETRRAGDVDVVGLLTTVTGPYHRVSMHGVRTTLVDAQASALSLPVHRVTIPAPCTNAVYETRMALACAELVRQGVTRIVFGDIFLEDVRRYREEHLAGTGLTPMFPLWGRPTDRLAREMLGRGVRARLVCLDPTRLPRNYAGRAFDSTLLDSLPSGVDPCGENGEFHTFVEFAPAFRAPVGLRPGRVVERDGFVFADLVPTGPREGGRGPTTVPTRVGPRRRAPRRSP